MRRPLRSFEEKVAATIRNPARGTAAGARVPSALPVPRQRIPRLIGGGSPAVAIPDPPTWAGYNHSRILGSSGGTYEVYQGTIGSAGQVVTGNAVAIGGAWTPPAGWTTLQSGTVGTLSYWVGYITLTGSDDLTFTLSASTANLYRFDRYSAVDAALTYQCSAVATGTDVFTTALTAPTAGWLLPRQTVFAHPYTLSAASVWCIPDGDPFVMADQWGYLVEYGVYPDRVFRWHTEAGDPSTDTYATTPGITVSAGDFHAYYDGDSSATPHYATDPMKEVAIFATGFYV